jgi:hypothetical protein
MTQAPVSLPHPAAPDHNNTFVLAIELSNKSWVLAAQVLGLTRVKAKRTIEPMAEALLAALQGYRERAKAAGRYVERVIAIYEAGWSGFWLARLLATHGVEPYVVQPSSVLVDRRARRAKSDGIDAELLLRNRRQRGDGRPHMGLVHPTAHQEVGGSLGQCHANPQAGSTPLRVVDQPITLSGKIVVQRPQGRPQFSRGRYGPATVRLAPEMMHDGMDAIEADLCIVGLAVPQSPVQAVRLLDDRRLRRRALRVIGRQTSGDRCPVPQPHGKVEPVQDRKSRDAGVERNTPQPGTAVGECGQHGRLCRFCQVSRQPAPHRRMEWVFLGDAHDVERNPSGLYETGAGREAGTI